MDPFRPPRPVIVKTPLSRRRVLAVSGGVAAVVGALRLATWANERQDDRTRLPASPPTLAIAIPTGGDAREVYANRPVLTAVRRVLGDVEHAGRGRFRLTVEEIPQPPAPASPATPTPQIIVLGPLMASGAPPDLLTLTSWTGSAAHPNELTLIADTKALLPLDDLLKANAALTLGDFYPAALDVCRNQGKLLAVPLTAMPQLLVYDEQRFASAAVAPPDAGWGWIQLLDAARRLTAPPTAPDQYGLIPTTPVAYLLALVWQNGGDVTSSAKTQAQLTDPRTREAIEYFAAFYADRPASLADSFTGWKWNGDGVRVNGRWWAAMTHTTAPGSFVPPVPGATDHLKAVFGEWLDNVREAFGASALFRSPMRFARLPPGRRRASAMSVTSTLSVTHKTRSPDVAATALALLAEHVSQSIVPSARRLGANVIQRLAPHYSPDQAQLLVTSLADGRTFVAGDHWRTNQVLGALWNGLVQPIQRRARPLDEVIDSTNRSVQAILDRP